MRIKTYLAETVRAAIEQARQELGPDAMLLNTRRTSEPGRPCLYEVVFGTTSSIPPDSAVPPPLPAPEQRHPEPAAATAAAHPPAQDAPALGELRRMVSEMQHLLEEASEVRHKQPPPAAELSRNWEEKLLDRNFEPATARAIVAAISGDSRPPLRPVPRTPAEWESSIRREIRKLVHCDNVFDSLGRAATIALAGPPAAGKTTTLASIAIQYGVSRGFPVHFVSFDSHSSTGGGVLAEIAALAGFSHTEICSLAELRRFLMEKRPDGLVLIDLPGYSFSEQRSAQETGRLLKSCPGVETHLVLPASLWSRDLVRYGRMYAGFSPRTVIASRMDETADPGGMISVCRVLNLPVSLTKRGQDIPDSLQPARESEFLEDLFQTEARAAASVA
jgi:flagellar biosynthesis protein FlhF